MDLIIKWLTNFSELYFGKYVWAIPFIRAVLCADIFLIIGYIYRSMSKSDTKKLLRYIDGRVQIDTSGINWADKEKLMRARGIEFYNPKFLQPHYFIIGCIVCMVLMSLTLALIFDMAGIPMWFCIIGISGLFAPMWYFKRRDKQDNEKMGQDIMSISSALSIQVTGGEYLGEALSECRNVVQTPRLKDALTVFDRHLKCNDMTMIEALEEFGNKFTSDEVLSLVTIMKQGIETGQTAQCARDLSKQCLQNRESAFGAKKAHLDRAVTIAMLLVFADGIGFIIWRFAINLLSQF